ncbi:MAG: amidohydrolase family protein [Acidimicrobiales bacterium]|nr:amidohydrolase family protein [Acidimicrobiales bacterium]
MTELTVFTAKRIITMDDSLPNATAIAVRGERIVEVGTIETLQPWLRHHEHVIDDRFAGQVMIAGLIDPHIHPSLMAILLNCEWLPSEPWDLPAGRIEAPEGSDEFLAGVAQLHAAKPPGEPLVIFGYHAQYHGSVERSDLDTISTERPIALWQRSFHEVRANSAALSWFDAEEGAAWDPHIELSSGRMYESGMVWALRTLTPHLLGDGKYERALADVSTLIHRGGITAMCDAGFGIGGYDQDYDTYDAVLGRPETPFRTYLMPQIAGAKSRWKSDTIAQLEAWEAERGNDRISFIKAAKLLADGAFIAQLMVLGEPGYIDGHEGAWLTEPDRLAYQMSTFWEAGYDLHIHCNGDVGVSASLDAVEALLHAHPRFDHRTTLHHFGISTQAQMRRIKALGVEISANGYYLYQFGDRFVDEWLGTERASQMTRLGAAERAGVSVSLHSDLPMGPAAPLLAAQACATRRTRGGAVMGETERLSLDAALRSITIDAAYQLRLDHEIGSLVAGKLADVTVLEADPFDVGADGLADIAIVATIVGGEVYPLA